MIDGEGEGSGTLATRATGDTSKILIADDSELIRASIRELLASRDGWIICGEACDGQQAVEMTEELKPDLIIVDLVMPRLTGLQAAAEILKKQPQVPILLYTMHQSNEMDLEAKKTGIRRVIAKSDSTEVLLRGIEELLASKNAAASIPVVLAEGQAQAETKIIAEQLAETPANPEVMNGEPALGN